MLINHLGTDTNMRFEDSTFDRLAFYAYVTIHQLHQGVANRRSQADTLPCSETLAKVMNWTEFWAKLTR
jgi:hypothetical protein